MSKQNNRNRCYQSEKRRRLGAILLLLPVTAFCPLRYRYRGVANRQQDGALLCTTTALRICKRSTVLTLLWSYYLSRVGCCARVTNETCSSQSERLIFGAGIKQDSEKSFRQARTKNIASDTHRDAESAQRRMRITKKAAEQPKQYHCKAS